VFDRLHETAFRDQVGAVQSTIILARSLAPLLSIGASLLACSLARFCSVGITCLQMRDQTLTPLYPFLTLPTIYTRRLAAPSLARRITSRRSRARRSKSTPPRTTGLSAWLWPAPVPLTTRHWSPRRR
jgi:hypothetical protein